MELTTAQVQLVQELIELAWSAGAVRSRESASRLEQLRAKILAHLPTPTRVGGTNGTEQDREVKAE